MFPMTITIKNTVQLQAVLAILDPENNEYAKQKAVQAEPTTEPVAKPAPKAKAAAASAQAQEATAPAATTVASPSEPEAPQIDVEQVKAAIMALAKAKGREAAVAVLSAFGAAKVPDLKPSQYAEVLEASAKAGA